MRTVDYRHCITTGWKKYFNPHGPGSSCWCGPVTRPVKFEDGTEETWIIHRNYAWDGERWNWNPVKEPA